MKSFLRFYQNNCCGLLFASPAAMAKTQTIEATGVYQMGENDTIASAKENTRKDVMRNAAEKAGVYVRSYSKTKNLKPTDDQVEVISIQTMQVKDCTYTQDYLNNTLVIHAAIKASVDDNDFQECIDANNQIQSLQSQLAEEKEKNRETVNRKMRDTGNDPYANLLAETELKRLQKNPSNISVVRSNLEDFVEQRNGIVPADIYGRIAQRIRTLLKKISRRPLTRTRKIPSIIYYGLITKSRSTTIMVQKPWPIRP